MADFPSTTNKKRVVIAGISGFIGRSLGKRLRAQYHVIGITRVRPAQTSPNVDSADEWREGDLLSLADSEACVQGADYAFYLVHSMLPSARLAQGSFIDFDLIAADNFARAAKKAGVKQIIYLGGIKPAQQQSSRHLESRHEVETALKWYQTPVTVLRAGLVIGAEGSSFLTLARTLERLPVLFCPPWADTLSHPIGLQEIIDLLSFCIGRPEVVGKIYDVGGPELMSYRTMLNEIARTMGRQLRHYSIPISNVHVLQFFVSLISGAPKELVLPLIESLRYPIVAPERKLNAMAGIPGRSFREVVEAAIRELRAIDSSDSRGNRDLPIAFQKPREERLGRTTVRSVQRFPLPPGRTAEWVAREYMSWVPYGLKFLVRVQIQNDEIFKFCLFFLPRYPLLVMRRSLERSWPDRFLFWIEGGLLVAPAQKQRLEFREVLGKYVIAGVHNYRPSLPWFIYLNTQARIHLWVMSSFRRYLQKVSGNKG